MDQFNEPSFHSWNNPSVTIRINKIYLMEKEIKLKDITKMGIGSKIMISISKIRNNTANKKNRVENGKRALDKESNPHSNGEIFSRFNIAFILIELKINNKKNVIVDVIIKEKAVIIMMKY